MLGVKFQQFFLRKGVVELTMRIPSLGFLNAFTSQAIEFNAFISLYLWVICTALVSQESCFQREKKANCIHGRTGRERQGTGKGTEHMIWNFGNRQTNRNTPHLWVSASPLFPPSTLSGSEYTEQGPGSSNLLLNSRSGYSTVLLAPPSLAGYLTEL